MPLPPSLLMMVFDTAIFGKHDLSVGDGESKVSRTSGIGHILAITRWRKWESEKCM